MALAFCWSHVRRRFYELAAAGPAPIATEALARIGALYAIENDIRGRSPNERRDARQEKSRPILEALEPWLHEKLALISQKTRLAEAIRYALSRWDGLTRFIDNGRIEIDSNIVERAIRPIALNRKNALFAGSDEGASYCSSDDVLIDQEIFGTSFQISGGVAASRRLRGGCCPSARHRGGLSAAPRSRVAELEARRW